MGINSIVVGYVAAGQQVEEVTTEYSSVYSRYAPIIRLIAAPPPHLLVLPRAVQKKHVKDFPLWLCETAEISSM